MYYVLYTFASYFKLLKMDNFCSFLFFSFVLSNFLFFVLNKSEGCSSDQVIPWLIIENLDKSLSSEFVGTYKSAISITTYIAPTS